MTAALLGPVGTAPSGTAPSGTAPSASGSASGSGDGAPAESTFAGLLSILAGPPAGAEAASAATGTPAPGPGKGGRHAADTDDAAQTPAAAVAGTLVATVLATGGTVPLAVAATPGSSTDPIAATSTAGAASNAITSAAAGTLTADGASGTARPAPIAGRAGFAATLTTTRAPGTQPGGIPVTLPVTGPDGSAPAAPAQPATPNPTTPNPATPRPTTPHPTTGGPARPAPSTTEPILPGTIVPVGKHTHVTPQQPLPIGDDASTADSTATGPASGDPTQLGATPLPTAAPAAPSLPPVAAPPPSYAGLPVDAQPELSGALARLRSHGDGSHELTVSLHPAELGAVNISATLRGDQLTVTVACSSDAARAAVTAALPNLHHQLAGAGFGGVDVQFGNPSQSQSQNTSQNASQNPGQAHREPAPGQDQPSGRHRASQQAGAPERRRAVHDAALDRLL